MQQSASIRVRVNCLVVRQIRLRGPENNPELVIVDPLIGAFAVDDRDQCFQIDVLDLNIPTEVRSMLPNCGWRRVSAQALIAMLSAATNEIPESRVGDRSSWVHGSDIVELEGLRLDAEPNDVRARRGFRKAARILYAARIPYLVVGEYEDPEAIDGCTQTALVVVPNSRRAHECLCSSGFEPHPRNVNSVISAEYNCAIHLVPGKGSRRKRNDPEGSSQS